MKKLKLFSLALMALFTTSLWAVDPTQIYANGYENGAGTWSTNLTVSSADVSRTGEKSIKGDYTGSTSAKNATQNTGCSQSSSSSVYCHIIGYAKAEEGSSTTVQIGFTSSKKSNATTLSNSTWTKLTYSSNSIAPSTIIIYKAGAKTGAYFDDIVAYYSESSTIDLTAPSAATNAVPTVASISWTNGEDTGTGATGIQNTLIWHRTSGSAKDLTLNDQGIYSLTSTEGPNKDQSGNWTLVSASVAANATSYSGTFTPGDVYAIVHRDLAYNYSTPTYVTIPAAGDFTVIYKAGAGTGDDVTVQHAVTVADCPNTFTYEGYAFNGWKDSGNNDVAVGSIVSSDMTLTAQWKRVYTITYANGGGSGSAPAAVSPKAQGETFEVAENTFTAPTGKDFDKWNDGTTDYDPGDTYTVGTANVTLTAVWKDRPVSTDATLSALSITGCTLNETFAPATTAYTADLPFYASMPKTSDVTATKNDEHAADPEVSIAGNVITIHCVAEDGKTEKDYTVTITIAPVPTTSSSINIEQLVLDYGTSYAIGTALSDAHISSADYNSLDSLNVGDSDNSRPDYNEPFLGLKIKKLGGYIQMVIPAGQTLKVKFGSIAADLKLTINEVAQSDISKSTSVYEHTASGNELIKIATSSGGTVVLKQIMIGEDIAVVRPFEATVAPTTNGTASVELPKYAKGEQVTVNCAPATGYQLDNITVSGFDNKGVATNVEVADGKFTMPGSPVTITVTFSVATALDNTNDEVKAVKVLRNGQLFIEKNGKIYNALGIETR